MSVDAEEELAERIRRFPEQYPRSIGGLLPDKPVAIMQDPDVNMIQNAGTIITPNPDVIIMPDQEDFGEDAKGEFIPFDPHF